ncbi:VOC family protein [Patescibacteria group bacterium]
MIKPNSLKEFLDVFYKKILETSIDVSNYNMDHVAYQASSADDYGSVVKKLSSQGDLLQEPLIGGRRVAMIKLGKPIEHEGNKILALEVLEPKVGQVCESGWEHAEYVIDISFDEMMQKYPDLPWITNSTDRSVFAHLKLNLGEDMQVKFHTMDILGVINIGKEQ